jgi:hypothetical protein
MEERRDSSDLLKMLQRMAPTRDVILNECLDISFDFFSRFIYNLLIV